MVEDEDPVDAVCFRPAAHDERGFGVVAELRKGDAQPHAREAKGANGLSDAAERDDLLADPHRDGLEPAEDAAEADSDHHGHRGPDGEHEYDGLRDSSHAHTSASELGTLSASPRRLRTAGRRGRPGRRRLRPPAPPARPERW